MSTYICSHETVSYPNHIRQEKSTEHLRPMSGLKDFVILCFIHIMHMQAHYLKHLSIYQIVIGLFFKADSNRICTHKIVCLLLPFDTFLSSFSHF